MIGCSNINGLELVAQIFRPVVDSPFRAIFDCPLEIMNDAGRKSGPQSIQHGKNVDDFLRDSAAHGTEIAGGGEAATSRPIR